MTWSTRQPKPKIKIFAKKKKDLLFDDTSRSGGLPAEILSEATSGQIYAPINDVISITTSNGINQASGSFTIELVYRNLRGIPYYYYNINPMDIVIIYLDGETTTMVGMIDDVSKERSLRGGKLKRSVVLTGKSLGSIWEFDLVKYFEYTTGIPEALLQRNLALQSGLIKLDFFGQNLITTIRALYRNLPAIDIAYKDKNLSDFIDVGSELLCRRDELIYNLNTEPYSGTIFNYFKRYIGLPFNEIWTDSKDDKLFLRTRPTPFSMDGDGVKTISGGTHTGLESSWEHITNWHGSTKFDDSILPHVNTWEIPASDVIGESISRTHRKSYSIYGVLPVDKLYGSVPEYQALPPLIIEDDYAAFGSRDNIVRIGFIPLKPEGGLGDSANEIFKKYRNDLYLWNKDNHRYEGGTLTIKSRPLISAGDKINYDGKTFYTTTIQHTWRYGQPMQSVVSVDRGMEDKERLRRYKDGKKNI